MRERNMVGIALAAAAAAVASLGGPASAFEQGENVHVANVYVKTPLSVSTNVFDATSKTPVVTAGLQWGGETWTAQIDYFSGMQVMTPGSAVTDPDITSPEYQIFCDYSNGAFAPCNQSPDYLARNIVVDNNTGALSFVGGSNDYWIGGSYYPAVRDRQNGVPDVDGVWFSHTWNATDGKKWLVPDEPAYFLFARRPNDKDTALTCTLDNGVAFKLVIQKYPTMTKDGALALTYGDDGNVSGAFKFDASSDLMGWKSGIPGTKLYGDSTSIDRVTGNIVVANSANQSRTTGHCALRSNARAF
ncbi:MAG TPA: hypothetical protein VMD53_08310 [Rhizomicrobium sp.]|nr:hypothetical protein [Rhizomicrobium sp.]